MTAHKHAELMALYAQDAAETDKPWERWEHRSDRVHSDGSWFGLNDHPSWNDEYKYRRKPQKKAVDLSVLVRSGIDCEFSNNRNFSFPTWDMLNSISNRLKPYNSNVHSFFKYCRPRMNHWHSWQGGECPLPEGVKIEIIERNGFLAIGTSEFYGWHHDDDGDDIIAFKVTGLSEGYCWPWELDNG